jgi:hypothetical protein
MDSGRQLAEQALNTCLKLAQAHTLASLDGDKERSDRLGAARDQATERYRRRYEKLSPSHSSHAVCS